MSILLYFNTHFVFVIHLLHYFHQFNEISNPEYSVIAFNCMKKSKMPTHSRLRNGSIVNLSNIQKPVKDLQPIDKVAVILPPRLSPGGFADCNKPGKDLIVHFFHISNKLRPKGSLYAENISPRRGINSLINRFKIVGLLQLVIP